MRHGQGWTAGFALSCLFVGSGWLTAAAHGEDWALPNSRMGIRTAPLLLLSRPDVQADLRLDPGQIGEAQRTINELSHRAAALRGKTGTAVIAGRRAIDEAQVDWLSKNLTGNQLVRLRQIEIQWEGAAAMLSRPTVVDFLKLTPEQRQSLAQIISSGNAQRSRGPGDQAALNRQAQGVLSVTQKELWDGLLGSPCRFALSSTPPRTRDEATRQAGHAQPRH